MSGPPFIAVLPAEVERYGAASAIILALIRYRTGTDGPGRIERDGYRWWRVTHRDLATATGLSTKAVRTALKALGGVLIAKHFPPLANQTLAYRMVSGDDALTCQLPAGAAADLPVAEAGIPDAPAGTDRAPAGTPPCPSGHLHLSLENLEKGGEGASAPADTGDATAANSEPSPPDPFDYGDDSPDPFDPFVDAAPADAGPPNPNPHPHPGPEPPTRCSRHAHIDGWVSERCGPCRDQGPVHDRWTDAYTRWRDGERKAIKAEIDVCTDCGPNGMTEPDDPDEPARRCRRHRQLSDTTASRPQEARR